MGEIGSAAQKNVTMKSSGVERWQSWASLIGDAMTLKEFVAQHECSVDEQRRLREYLLFLRWKRLMDSFNAND